MCNRLQHGGIKSQVGVVDGIGVVDGSKGPQPIGILWKYFKAPVGDNVIFISFCPDISLQGHQDLVLLCKDRGQVDIGDIVFGPFPGIKCQAAGQIEGKTCLQRVFRGGKECGVEFACFLAGSVGPDTGMLQEQVSCNIDQVHLVLPERNAAVCGMLYPARQPGGPMQERVRKGWRRYDTERATIFVNIRSYRGQARYDHLHAPEKMLMYCYEKKNDLLFCSYEKFPTLVS